MSLRVGFLRSYSPTQTCRRWLGVRPSISSYQQLATFKPSGHVAQPYQLPRTEQRCCLSGRPGGRASAVWARERAVSIATVGSLVAGIYLPYNYTVDIILNILLPLHSYQGLSHVVMDYVHAQWLRRICQYFLLGVTTACAAGLFYFNQKDVGITGALLLLWEKCSDPV